MTVLLIQIFVALCAIPLILSIWRKDEIIQYPFLSAAVMLGWVCPQFIALTGMTTLPPGALDKTIAFSILCLGAGYAGYWMNRSPTTILDWRLSHERLLVAAGVLSALGAVSFYKVSQLAAEAFELYGDIWSGPITIYVMFSSMLTVGFVISIVLYIARPSLPALCLMLFGLSFFLYRIIVWGRRAAMAEIMTIALFAIWFRFRRAPPAIVVLPMLFVGALVVNSIGEYRNVMLDRDAGIEWSGAGLEEVLAIDWVGNMVKQVQDPDRAQELLNAVLQIAATDRLAYFDFGTTLWDALVFSYVPAQFLGAEFKASLMFDHPDQALVVFNHDRWPGTTLTGMTDAYQSFWYFGALKFALVGLIMSRLYLSANAGAPAARILSMLLLVPSLHAITHSTHWFFVAMTTNLIFLMPALLYARVPAVEPIPAPEAAEATARSLPAWSGHRGG
jgi:hypothetical protein